MSRSYKKPFGPVCKIKEKEMKQWKTKADRSLRRNNSLDMESNSKSHYKKYNDIWSSPSDGKCYKGEDPKWKRK